MFLSVENVPIRLSTKKDPKSQAILNAIIIIIIGLIVSGIVLQNYGTRHHDKYGWDVLIYISIPWIIMFLTDRFGPKDKFDELIFDEVGVHLIRDKFEYKYEWKYISGAEMVMSNRNDVARPIYKMRIVRKDQIATADNPDGTSEDLIGAEFGIGTGDIQNLISAGITKWGS